MKRITGLVVVLLVSGLIFSGCEGCKKEAPEGEVVIEETVETTGEVSEEGKKISDSLSKALCKRMVECAPGTLTEEECVTQTVTSLNEAQAVKPLDISDGKLKACIASINSGKCEEVLGTEPPKDCEFLK